MAQVRHLALDGSRHEIEADLDLHRPFTSVADLDVGGHRHELTSGPLTLGEEVATALGIGGFTEELSYEGGTLRIATGTVTDPRTGVGDKVTVAAWHGRAYSLVASLYNATTADVLRILGAVRIIEHDGGIALAPAGSGAGSGAVLGRVLVLKEVPGLGLLEISGRTRDAVRELPDWAGLALPSGELFQDTLSNGRPYFVLSAPSAMVTVLPLAGGDAVTASVVAGLLGSLRVSVRPAAGPLW